VQQAYVCPLPPEEAHRRLRKLCLQLWYDEYSSGFYPQHPIPETQLAWELRSYWAGQIDEIHGWKFWDNLADVVRDGVRGIWESVMRPALEAVLGGLGWIASRAAALVESVLRAAAQVGGWLWSCVRSAVSHLWDWLTTVAKGILDGISAGVSAVWGAVQRVPALVADALRGAFDILSSVVRQASSWVLERLEEVKSALSSAFSAAWDSLRNWLGKMMGEIIDALKTLASWIREGLAAAGAAVVQGFRWVWDSVLVPAAQAAVKGLEWIWDHLTAGLRWLLDRILGVLSSWAPMTPERAPSAMYEVLKLAGAGFTALAGLTLVGEAVHPLKQLGFPHLAAILYDLSGYKLVTGAAFTALGTMMFGYPFRYFFANVFRPRMPSEQQVLEAYLEGEIDEATAKRMLGYHGYHDSYFPMMVAVADRPVSPMLLNRIAQAGYYDEQLFRKAFADAHYPFEIRPVLLHYMQQVAMGELKAVYASVAVSRYREGLTNSELFLEELKLLRVQEALRGSYVIAGDLMRDYDLRSEVLKEAKRAFRQGEIDEGAFVAIAQSLELDAGYWEQWRRLMHLIPRESTPASKEVEVRAIGREAVVRRFREGLTLEEGFRNEARLLGYTPPQVDRLYVLALLERDYDYCMERLKAAHQAYDAGVLDDQAFVQELADFILDPQKIQLELLKAKYRKAPKVKRKVP